MATSVHVRSVGNRPWFEVAITLFKLRSITLWLSLRSEHSIRQKCEFAAADFARWQSHFHDAKDGFLKFWVAIGVLHEDESGTNAIDADHVDGRKAILSKDVFQHTQIVVVDLLNRKPARIII